MAILVAIILLLLAGYALDQWARWAGSRGLRARWFVAVWVAIVLALVLLFKALDLHLM